MAQLVCMYIGLDPEDEGLGLYQRELEDLLLASTKQFYDRKAREWIASSTFSEYLLLAEVRTGFTYTGENFIWLCSTTCSLVASLWGI